jgi:hypothetical protein
MPRYKVTLTRTSVEIVEAANQFQAAVVANEIGGDSAQILSVTPAVGRPTASARSGASTRSTRGPAPATKVAKKRRPLSPEAKAKLAQNLVKARAARAAKRTATAAPAKKARAAKKRS